MKASSIIMFKYVGFACASFFMPIKYAFIFTLIFVLVDTITGVMKAGKDSVKNIKSKRAFNGIVPKLIFYSLFIIMAHSLSIWIEPSIPFVKFALIGIGWIELKSIDENFRALFGFSFIDKTLNGIKSLKSIKRSEKED